MVYNCTESNIKWKIQFAGTEGSSTSVGSRASCRTWELLNSLECVGGKLWKQKLMRLLSDNYWVWSQSVQKMWEKHVVPTGCRKSGPDTSQVANETGRWRVLITQELITVMEQKCQVLGTLKPPTNTVNVKETRGGKQQWRSPQDTNTVVAMTDSKCVLCFKSHHLYKCTAFLSKDVPQRRPWVQTHNFLL